MYKLEKKIVISRLTKKYLYYQFAWNTTTFVQAVVLYETRGYNPLPPFESRIRYKLSLNPGYVLNYSLKTFILFKNYAYHAFAYGIRSKKTPNPAYEKGGYSLKNLK